MKPRWQRPALAGLAAIAMLTATAITASVARAATIGYEAEEATISRGTVQSNHAGFTGTGFVDYANEVGSSVEWAVSSADARSATMIVRYANGTTADRPTSVTVNGALVATLTFPPSGGWTTWATQSVVAPLRAGSNAVRVTATTAGGGPNIDSLIVDAAPAPSPSASTGPPDWSVAVVETAMTQSNATIMASWNYQSVLFLYGQYLVYQRTRDQRYLDYITSYVNRYVSSAGTLNARLDSLDNMLGGNLLLALYAETHQERYRTAAAQIRARLTTYPRLSDGAFQHMTTLPSQVWADGVYMIDPFLARYGKAFGADADLDEAARQLLLYDGHLARPNGLLWHGYDEARAQPWADPITGNSPESWCRSIGWVGMATVDVLDVLPADHAQRPALVNMVRTLAKAFATYQDPATGRWFQVVDKGTNADNWTETSCSSMYTYMLSRGVQRGYLDSSYRAVALRGYQGVLAKTSINATGQTSIADICIGTAVGDYASYISRPRRTNDLHGLGAFLIMNEQMRTTGAATG